MFKKDNFIPPLSSFELHRQASIDRNLAIQACMRRRARVCEVAAHAAPAQHATGA